MPNRTANANKAIATRWVEEQQLVCEGKGTRDWTPEQQRDIRDRGKAYDSDGKAFQGHHMKSVEMHPEYQGDSGNIQFLSRSEHIIAHNGSYQNPTNGYFNPFTGETMEFGDNKYKSCEVITLSDPIILVKESSDAHTAKNNDDVCSIYGTTQSSEDDAKRCEATHNTNPQNARIITSAGSKNVLAITGGKILGSIKRGSVRVAKFSDQHPVLTELVKITGEIAFVRLLKEAARSLSKLAGGGSSTSHSSNADAKVSISDVKLDIESTLGRGAPKSPHETSGYTRTRNGRKEHVKGYSTGKKTK